MMCIAYADTIHPFRIYKSQLPEPIRWVDMHQLARSMRTYMVRLSMGNRKKGAHYQFDI